MTTVSATVVAMVVLGAAGLLPTLALVGRRWITFPLVPLAGAVIAALAATGFVAGGGAFMVWFVSLAVAAAAATGFVWLRWPDRRPWAVEPGSGTRFTPGYRWFGALGAVGIVAACAWCLRDLSTPTVGFDARALWLTRAGWLLHSHQQLLITLRSPTLVLGQSAYPPLVSASTAVSWSVTGNHSLRLGVVVTALLNTCALAVAAFALVECGRRAAGRLADTAGRVWTAVPMVVGVIAAVLLIFIAFGISEPFMTNGYADPLWSLAAVGAVAYGLQMRTGRSEQGVVLLLLLVAGMSKDEGVVTAGSLIVLIALRGLVTMPADRRRILWWRPVVVGAVELAAVAAWPALMRLIHARGQTSGSLSPAGDWWSRAHATADGMAPYLHVLVLAAPVAVVGGLLLSGARRRSGVANDGWGWAGLACGLVAVGGALVVGSSGIAAWLLTTVHRVTEFPALTGWWIVATWAVVASASPALARMEERAGSREGTEAAPPEPGPEDGREGPTHADAGPGLSPRVPELR
ncbi:MAG TPA: hypothetical protein VHU85_14470 [Acidimicrobiales bacterium]|jgi:hypothetical protein|nr:hypothetical protein [Acidimicrobiales bacterium]